MIARPDHCHISKEKSMTIELAKTQGLKQGIEQQKKEVVLKSFNAGLDRQIIQQITGLNEDQIDEIINHDE